MRKHIRTLFMLGLVMIFIASGCALMSVKKPAPAVGIPLVGLTWNGEPCVHILVPKELPQEFIEQANDLMIGKQCVSEYLITLAFATDDFIITVWATRECPAFIALDTFDRRTEEGKQWIWNTSGEFKEVTDAQYSKFMKGLTSEVSKSYCLDKKIEEIVFIETEVESMSTVEEMQDWKTVETTIGPCGPWVVVVNPGEGQYRVGYIHFHPVGSGMLPVKYGLMDKDGNSSHFILGEDGWEDSPYPMPSAEEIMRQYLSESMEKEVFNELGKILVG